MLTGMWDFFAFVSNFLCQRLDVTQVRGWDIFSNFFEKFSMKRRMSFIERVNFEFLFTPSSRWVSSNRYWGHGDYLPLRYWLFVSAQGNNHLHTHHLGSAQLEAFQWWTPVSDRSESRVLQKRWTNAKNSMFKNYLKIPGGNKKTL